VARTRDTAESGRGSGKVLVLIAAGPLSWLLAPLLSLPLVLARVKWPPPSTPHAPRQSSCVSSLILLSTLPSVRMAEPLRSLSLSLPNLPTFRCLRHPSPSIAAVGLVLIVAPRLASPYALAHTDIAENYQHETKVVEFVPPHELLQRIDFSLPEQGTPLDADLTGTHPNSHARERERPSLYETMSTSYDIPLESRSPA